MKTISKLLCGFVMTLILTVMLVFAFEYEEARMMEADAVEAFEEIEPEVTESEFFVSAAAAEEKNEPEEVTILEKPETMEPEETSEETDAAAGFKPLDIPLDTDVQEYLKAKCDESNIDFAFVIALMDIESNFKADAHSKTGDYGLMQINRCNHKALSLKTGAVDFLDPYQNIDAGMWMLADLFEKYEEAEPVLMAYHFGEGGAKKLWAQGKYTSAYSQNILDKQLVYAEMMNDV